MPSIFTFSADELLLRLGGFVIVATLHGFVLAAVAYIMGDPTPSWNKRVSINPVTQIELPGLVYGLLFWSGWSRPMKIDASKLRLGRAGLALTVVLALLATLAIIAVLHQVRAPLATGSSDFFVVTAISLIQRTEQIGVWFFLLNLVPLPPFTGWHFLAAASPSIAARLNSLRWWIIAALAILALFGQFQAWLGPVHSAIASFAFR